MQTYFGGTPWGRRREKEAAAKAAEEAGLVRRVVAELTKTVTRLEEENATLRQQVGLLREDLDRHIAGS